MGHNATVTIWIEDVQAGAVCSHAIVDPAGVLLLGENTAITQDILDGLTDRGIDRLEVDPRDVASLRVSESTDTNQPGRQRNAAKNASKAARTRKSTSRYAPGKPLKDRLTDRFEEPFDRTRHETLRAGFKAASGQMEELREAISQRKLRTIEAVDQLTHSFADYLVDDHDQTIGAFGGGQKTCDLTERCIKLASLGMAVGVEMGLDGLAVTQLGLAGLLHDVGLFSMDEKYRIPNSDLSDEELWHYQKHPIVSQQCLADVVEVPNQVRIAVEQVHEQFNGKGYPRGLEGKRIHPYARILNVVDTYLKLILPTANRVGILPHDAIGVLLHQGRRGFFEPQVIHAFLLTESLFPLGSHVELTDGTIARVIRRPREGYATPILQNEDGDRIDPGDSSQRIARPAPDDDQVRVTQEMMGTMDWEAIDADCAESSATT